MKKYFIGITIVAVSALAFFWNYGADLAIQSEMQDEMALTPAQPVLQTIEERYPYVIQPGSTFATALDNLDISAQDIHNLVVAAKQHKDLGRLNSGTRFQITFADTTNTKLVGVRIRLTEREVIDLTKVGEQWQAEKILKKVEKRIVTFKGTVQSSLWDSAVQANMNPTLIAELAEVFAWQVDFAREVQENDRWRLSVEEELVQGQHVGWGAILSAEYINKETVHTAVLFRRGEEDIGYFAPDGSSLKRIFLKSPIQYGRISSRFQKKRFHPILKISRPHLGVDYAAPTGTPVRSVGDGTITSIGYKGGGGNVVTIRHNSTYTTAYKHLSRFASGMRVGKKVQQGQTIAYVGSTGLSSGPHLHFEFFVNGRFVDPMGQKFPTAEPVPRDQLVEFDGIKNSFLAFLPSWKPFEEFNQQ